MPYPHVSTHTHLQIPKRGSFCYFLITNNDHPTKQNLVIGQKLTDLGRRLLENGITDKRDLWGGSKCMKRRWVYFKHWMSARSCFCESGLQTSSPTTMMTWEIVGNAGPPSQVPRWFVLLKFEKHLPRQIFSM